MIKITIAQTTLRSIGYTDKKGNPAQLLIQTAYAHTVDQDGNPPPYPEKIEIILPRGVTNPHAAGDYTLHPSAIQVDQRGRLTVETRLTPSKTPAARG